MTLNRCNYISPDWLQIAYIRILFDKLVNCGSFFILSSATTALSTLCQGRLYVHIYIYINFFLVTFENLPIFRRCYTGNKNAVIGPLVFPLLAATPFTITLKRSRLYQIISDEIVAKRELSHPCDSDCDAYDHAYESAYD